LARPPDPKKRRRYICAGCGKTFIGWRKNKRKFCSHTCYGESMRLKRERRTCKQCGRPYEVVQAYAKRGQMKDWCSLACYRKATKRGSPVTKICTACGKQFQVEHRHAARISRCSRECRKKRVEQICPTCGEVFETVPSQPRVHCSMACYRRSRAETMPETMVREEIERMGLAYEQEVGVGRYAVDFLIAGWLAVEVDGAYWHENGRDSKPKEDAIRSQGWTLLRLPLDGVNDGTRLSAIREIARALVAGSGWSASRLKRSPRRRSATT
jgi:very-short-patch-repair endonuclease